MLSFKTAQLLKELLHQQLLLEEELERMRITLCLVEDFEPHAAFQQICSDPSRRSISDRDIQLFLISNRFNQPHEGCSLFVMRHCHEKNQASELFFSEFLESVLPVSKERLREETAQRISHVDQSKCSFESEINLSQLLNHEISKLLKLERLKDDLATSCEGFSINGCFRAIDPEGLGFIDQDALSNFMKKNGCMIPATQLPMLLRSISGKQNGVIELKQFTQFIKVQFPELIASKYRPLPMTCYYPSIDDYTTFYKNRPYLSGRAVQKGDEGEQESNQNEEQLIQSLKQEKIRSNDVYGNGEDTEKEIEEQNERELKDRIELEEERIVLEQELQEVEEEVDNGYDEKEDQCRKVEEVDEEELREGQDLEDEEDQDQNNEEQEKQQEEEQDNQGNYEEKEEEDQRQRYQEKQQSADKVLQDTTVSQLSPKQQAQKGINAFLQSLKSLISLNRACENAKLEFLSISYFSPNDLFNFALSYVHEKPKTAEISSKTYNPQTFKQLSQTQHNKYSQQLHQSINKKQLPQTLTQTEFRNFLKNCIKCPSLDEQQITRIFHQIDTSNEGVIDNGKFIDFLAPSDPFVILHRQLAPITELTKLERQRLLELFMAVLDYLVELQNIKETYSKPVSIASAKSSNTPSLFQIFDYIDQDSDEYISIKDLEISLTEAGVQFEAADLSFLMMILSKNNKNPLSRHQKLITSKNHMSLISITMFIQAFNM